MISENTRFSFHCYSDPFFIRPTPLRYWFWMIFLMSRQKAGVSMLALQKMLKMPSYQTVWTIFSTRDGSSHRLFPLTDDHLFGANWITN